MGHLEMGGDIMGYQNYGCYNQENQRGLCPSFHIFFSLKRNSTKFCMLIENDRAMTFMAALLL